jgi:hypothetical protein
VRDDDDFPLSGSRGMGTADALVVNMVRRGPGQMTGMGIDVTGLLDSLTGGKVSAAEDQLQTLQTSLKLSIAASVISGIAGIAAIVVMLRKR